MVKKSILRLLTLLMCVSIAASLFAGCGKKETPPANTDQPKQEAAKDEQSIVVNVMQEPDTIDPGLETTVIGANICNQVFEGLMTFDKENKPVPAVAEKVDFDPANPTKYVFHIRKDAKWSDGQPLKAQDFEYAWKRVLDPKTAADYASQLYPLKNGEAFNANKAKAEDVGVKAVDDNTLEVELENPTPYFLQLCALPTLMPVRKDMVEKDPEKWTQSPDTYIGNGPFKMTQWTHDSEISLVKNENYWDKDKVKLEKVKFVMIAQSTQGLAAFEKGDVDYIDDVPSNEIPRLLQDKKMQINPYLGTYYLAVNNTRKGLDDPRVRKALSLAIDRPLLIEAVWKDGRKPATGWIPYGVADVDPAKQFRDAGGDFYDGKGNIEEAKRLLAEAGYPDGKGFPTFTYSYNQNETHAKIAQAIQDMWKKNLGIEVKLNVVDWKVFVPQRKEGNHDISRDGWIGDYLDPMTFMDILMSDNGNNDCQYKNPEYDKMVAAAKKEPDPAKRMQILHDAEKMLIDRDMALIPVAFYVNDVCIQSYVKNFYRIPTGMYYLKEVVIEGKGK